VLERPLTIALLTGSLTASHRRRVRSLLASGDVDIVIGTQALVQEGVDFPSLGLAIVDEQHRFGVLQRGGLRQKGYNPHVLVMTATPIPRSLALSIYGDLDLSVIDALPPGRQEISTRVFHPNDIHDVYARVREEVQKGRQVYVICPLINESDKLAARAATEEYEHLRGTVFTDLRLGLLHGAMRPADKDAVMRSFRDGGLDILVSTTVIEVGIDVPNATVMLVLGAERFGLSQLHQLRGRVGRGSEKSYCLLVGDTAAPEAMRRLTALESTHDGFKLAMQDLDMRGAGDFLGTQQSGLPPLKVATLTDLSTMEKARAEAQQLIRDERLLGDPMYERMRERVAKLWSTNVEWS
jgi:ATP-dependent DNA helicase RecG